MRLRSVGGQDISIMDDGETIRVIPVPDDPIPSLRGRGREQKATERLLAERKKDRDREESI
jgi:hypothetical protein